MKPRTAVSAVHVVVGVVVLAAVVLAGLYFFSDVWRTKMDVAYQQFADWTPENIAKDPVNYLNFCEAETNKAILKLKASEIAIAQKKSKLETMRDDARNKVGLGKTALEELKALYRKADPNGPWPVAWRAASLDKDQCKRQILKFAGEVRSKDELLKKLDAGVVQLNAQTTKVQEARDQANEQLAKIATNREMLKVQQITDDLKNNLVAMKSVIETSVVGVASAEPGMMSLDDLAAQSATTVDESEFNKIMGQ